MLAISLGRLLQLAGVSEAFYAEDAGQKGVGGVKVIYCPHPYKSVLGSLAIMYQALHYKGGPMGYRCIDL